MKRSQIGWLLSLFMVAAIGCSPGALTVSPATGSLPLGGSVQLVVTEGSTSVSGASFSSSDSTIASVDGNGLVLGVMQGMAVITVSSGGQTVMSNLAVSAPLVSSIEIAPLDEMIAINMPVTFTAEGMFTDGTSADVTAMASWTSANPMIASIDSDGTAHGVGVGTTTITVSIPGYRNLGPLSVSTTTSITVTPSLKSISVMPPMVTVGNGGHVDFKAIGVYSDGTMMDLTTAANWSSSASNVVTVFNANGSAGVAQSTAMGMSTITATYASIVGSATMIVGPATLVSVTINGPDQGRITRGNTFQATAVENYSDMTTKDVSNQVVWSTMNGNVVTVSNDGFMSAIAIGMTQVNATLNAQYFGVAPITVVAPVVSSIVVTPATPTIVNGATQQFTAMGTFTDKSTSDVTKAATWSSTAMNVATVGPMTGLATGLGGGSTTITALIGAVSGTATLTVN